MKTKLLLIIAGTFISSIADASVPIINSSRKLGPTLEFKTTGGITNIIPLYLKSGLKCYSMQSQHRCTLMVFNDLPASIEQELSLRSQAGEKFHVLRPDFSSDVVSSVHEGIFGSMNDYLKNAITQTFYSSGNFSVLGQRTPYARLDFRISKNLGSEIEDRYFSGVGLGDFQVSFNLNARKQMIVIQTEHVKTVKSLLQSIDAVEYKQLRSKLLFEVAPLFQAKGLDVEDQNILIVDYLKQLFFSLNSDGTYDLKPDFERMFVGMTISDQLVLMQELTPQGKYKCIARVNLKKSAESELSCEDKPHEK